MMQWATPKPPKIGSLRRVFKFAWLPVICDNGVTVWLERYWSHQELIEVVSADMNLNLIAVPEWREYKATAVPFRTMAEGIPE